MRSKSRFMGRFMCSYSRKKRFISSSPWAAMLAHFAIPRDEAATSAFRRGPSGTIDELVYHQPNGVFVAKRTGTAAQLRRLARKQNLSPRLRQNNPTDKYF